MNFKTLLILSIISFFCILLFPSLASTTPALIIEDVFDSPGSFSPSGDNVNNETTISATISASGFKGNEPLGLTWQVTIRDFQGKIVKKLYERTAIQNNSQVTLSQVWDGHNRRGKLVTNGTYTYKIDMRIKEREARPGFGEISVTGVPESAVPTLTIEDATDFPDSFSPAIDGNGATGGFSAEISIFGFGGYFKKIQKLAPTWTLPIGDSKVKPAGLFVHKQRVAGVPRLRFFNSGLEKTLEHGLSLMLTVNIPIE